MASFWKVVTKGIIPDIILLPILKFTFVEKLLLGQISFLYLLIWQVSSILFIIFHLTVKYSKNTVKIL